MLVTASVLAMLGLTPASADGGDSAGAIAQQAAEIGPPVDPVALTMGQNGTLTGVGESATTALPSSGDGNVTIVGESGLPLAVGLPDVADGASAQVAGNGSVVYQDSSGLADTLMQATDSGARIETIINTAEAPDRYTYHLDPLVTPELNGDGSVDLFIESDGLAVAVGRIGAPWATDADGKSVATHYEVHDGVLTQVVEHRSGNVAYPVVADPAFQADCGIVTCTIRFDRARTKWLGSHPNERDLVATLGCLGIGAVTEAIGGVICGVIAAVIVYHANKAAEYYAQGKCYSYRYTVVSPALGVASAVARNTYNCK